MNVLVTGGAGYIGSHMARRLLTEGHRVLIVDDLSRGHAAAIERLRTLPASETHLSFIQTGIDNREAIHDALRKHAIDTIMHFAAFAYVGESVQQPLLYYRNNAAGTLALLEAIEDTPVERFILSSSCATYGEPPADQIPIRETCPTKPINPYGWSKLFCEQLLIDLVGARANGDSPLAGAILRYFNVAGCDRQGLIGVDHDPETRIIPIVLRTILGQRERVLIYGDDYDTPDGTCLRDYIHPEDLADAHLAVAKTIQPGEAPIYNLGIGKGWSVREVIDTAQRIAGRECPVEVAPRRPGDPPVLYADASKIEREIGWRASITRLDEIIESMWRWYHDQPNAYR